MEGVQRESLHRVQDIPDGKANKSTKCNGFFVVKKCIPLILIYQCHITCYVVILCNNSNFLNSHVYFFCHMTISLERAQSIYKYDHL